MKYQLTCPKCKHEFAYDNGHIDAKIARLVAEQQSLQRQLTEHKLLPKDEQFRRTAWWKRTKARFAQVTEELTNVNALPSADTEWCAILPRIWKDQNEPQLRRWLEHAKVLGVSKIIGFPFSWG